MKRPLTPAPRGKPPFVEHCLELWAGAAPSGTPRARAMFGGWGLYSGDLFVALIASDELFVKVDAQTQAQFEAARCRPFVYEGKGRSMTMSFWTLPAEALESAALMAPWTALAVQAALRTKAAKAGKPAKVGKVGKAVPGEKKHPLPQ